MPSEHRATYLRAVLLSLLAAGLLVPLGYWAERLQLDPGLVPLFDPQGRSFWLAGIGAAVIVGLLSQVLDRDQSYRQSTAGARAIRYESAPELPTAWIYPFITTLAFVMLVAVYHSSTGVVAAALGAFLLLLIGAVTHHHLFDIDAAIRQRSRGVHVIAIHVVAFIALSMVYINKVRSLFSATGVLLIGVLLLLHLTEGEDTPFARRLVYALAGGVLLGQVTWVLNYWKSTGWTGGAALLVIFYLSAGLILNQVRDGVTARDVIEYGAVSAVAFGIVVYSLFM